MIVDSNPKWLEWVSQGQSWSAWSLAHISPHDLSRQHPLLKSGGWFWQPSGNALEIPRWKSLPSPWPQLAAWWLRELPLKSRQVCLVSDHSLGQLPAWLARQCLSLTCANSQARNLEGLVRLADVVVLFPGLSRDLEVHHFSPGVVLLDLRPESPDWHLGALSLTATALATSGTGSLYPLLACLSLAQQETPWELA